MADKAAIEEQSAQISHPRSEERRDMREEVQENSRLNSISSDWRAVVSCVVYWLQQW